jgi:hypothetical protein
MDPGIQRRAPLMQEKEAGLEGKPRHSRIFLIASGGYVISAVMLCSHKFLAESAEITLGSAT